MPSKYSTEGQRRRMAAYRARKKAKAAFPYAVASVEKTVRPHSSRVAHPHARVIKLRPFVGVDGEGAGRNKTGQQHYMNLRIGDAELWTGKPLSTPECLDFILAQPSDPIMVAFGLGYDATQILRGMADDPDRDRAEERVGRLFQGKPIRGSNYTHWGDYGIEYLPGQYLRICRLERFRKLQEDGTVRIGVRSIKGSVRTIYEVIGFFQAGFLPTITDWGIGPEHWEMIERNKKARGEFLRITREIREYNRQECLLLAKLMESFRSVCYAAKLKPVVGNTESWNGAGKLATYLHKQHRSITAKQLAKRTPPEVLRAADAGYFGGRFEVMRIGEVIGPLYEYDINSAYPDQMRRLPCLHHGKWVPQNSDQLRRMTERGAITLARVKFNHPPHLPFCGLPVRDEDGRVLFPRQGQGVYWGVELMAAQRLGASLEYLYGWRYERECSCQPYDWVVDLYAERLRIGKDIRGIPLKLAYNSLYGKLCQRIGSPEFSNMIHAGLITAGVRARLIDAVAANPSSCVMFATDAMFSTVPLDLPLSDALGDWSHKQLDRLFIVQAGLYWGAARPKTRGMPSESVFKDHIPDFESAWFEWLETMRMLMDQGVGPGWAAHFARVPSVKVPLRMFIGLKLAHARGDLSLAGRWMDIGPKGEPGDDDKSKGGKQFGFLWKGKRSLAPGRWGITDNSVWTMPLDGSPALVSIPHRGTVGLIEELDKLELSRAVYDEQPDHVAL